jgi:cell division protein FtsW
MEPAGQKYSYDHLLIAGIFVLTGVGLVTLYSSSYAFAELFTEDHNPYHFISRQIVSSIVGIFLFFLASCVSVKIIRKLVPLLVISSLILCIFPFIPGIGVTKNGASRWIALGDYTYQPSELVKLTLPLYLAHIFDKKKERLNAFPGGILPPALITSLFFFLIYRQNNFSTAVFIAFNALAVFFFAGIGLRYFLCATVMLIPISGLLVFSEEHRLRRFISFIWPDWEPLGAGYQVRSALITIGSGGFWGKGIGQGTRKIASIPEVHSDFIFASYVEEFGFAGVLLFFLLFGIFTIRGYRTALAAEDTFRRLLAFGLVTIISSQALVNIAVVSGILPTTGLPLPFFSAGGSSLFTTLAMTGLIVNISRHRKNREAPHV